MFLSYDWSNKHDAFIGVITDRHPRKGPSPVTVLSVTKKQTLQEIKDWFKAQCRDRPWLHGNGA